MNGNVVSVIVSILSGLVAVTALLLGQITSNYNTGVELHERLVRIEENQGRVRSEIDEVKNEIKQEIRNTRNEIRNK
jgi:hypothetical protein